MPSTPIVDVLVTGGIRDRQVFVLAFSMLLRLKMTGVFRNIIFSGWNEDLVRNSDLVDQLTAFGTKVVDNGSTLPIRSYGNYWDQLKTLETGLGLIEDGVYVFKTRPDLLFLGGEDTITEIISHNVGHTCGKLGFKSPIWIPSFVPMQPFFMADQCYLGLAEDLRKLVRYDGEVEVKGIHIPPFPGSKTHLSAAANEIRFWSGPFLHQYEVLREYKSVWPHAMNGYPQNQLLQDYNLASIQYQEYLAVYWQVLFTVFRISEGKFCLAHSIDAEGKVIPRANSPCNNSENFIDDAMQVRGNFPAAYSTDRGLRRFIDEANHPFYLSRYAPALERIRCYRYSPERIAGNGVYLTELRRLAQIHQSQGMVLAP